MARDIGMNVICGFGTQEARRGSENLSAKSGKKFYFQPIQRPGFCFSPKKAYDEIHRLKKE